MLKYLKLFLCVFILLIFSYLQAETTLRNATHERITDQKFIQNQSADFTQSNALRKTENGSIICEEIKPFAVLSASSVQELLTQVLKVSDNFYPQSSSVLSMLAISFLGSIQCPGLTDRMPCFLAFYFYQHTYKPVFVFHANRNCHLVNNLKFASKISDYGLYCPFKEQNIQSNWYLYGQKDLLNFISKNITTSIPFLKSKISSITDLLTLSLYPEQCNTFVSNLPPYAQSVYHTFIKDDIELLSCSINIDSNTIASKLKLVVTPTSALAKLFRTFGNTYKLHKHLKLNAEDDIQLLGFHPFHGIKTFLEESSLKIQESLWRNDTTSHQIYLWGKCLYPLLIEFINFLQDYFTGNYQCYQNLKQDKDLILLRNTGLCELKSSSKLTTFAQNEAIVSFLENFIKKSLHVQLSEAIKQKLVGSKQLQNLNLQLDKAIFSDKQYIIHGISFNFSNNSMHFNYPFVFGVYKNYLLYSDNLEDLKSLIKYLEKNKLIYESFPFSHKSFINVGQILQKSGYFKTGTPLISKTDSSIEVKCITQTNPNTIVVELKVPLSFDNMFVYLQKMPFMKQQIDSNKITTQ